MGGRDSMHELEDRDCFIFATFGVLFRIIYSVVLYSHPRIWNSAALNYQVYDVDEVAYLGGILIF